MSNENCTMCGADPIIVRPYSGEVLCEQCFRKSIFTKVRKAISKWRMLQRTDRIAVAISGGKDSAILLAMLVEIQSRFPESEIITITLDEGKVEDKERRQIVEKLAKQFDVRHVSSSYEELFSVTLDEVIARARELNSPLSPCAFCGVLRRQGLNVLARQIEADKLALGHNLDDEVQSMLMNLIRGDLQRLARLTPIQEGVRPWLIPRIKPLYYIAEKDLTVFVKSLGLPFQLNPCSYREESLRSEIRNWLNEFEERHPGSKYNLYATFSRLVNLLPKQAQDEFRLCRLCGEATSRDLCAPCELLEQLNLRLHRGKEE